MASAPVAVQCAADSEALSLRGLGVLIGALVSIALPSMESSGQSVQTTDHGEQAAAIQRLLDTQAASWNAGDLREFMDHYWKSDALTFSSGGRTTRGWQATYDRYLLKYPDRDAMGQLSFDRLEVISLGADACFVLGRWALRRHGDQPHGNFTLIVRKVDDHWRIVHDHTSVLEESH